MPTSQPNPFSLGPDPGGIYPDGQYWLVQSIMETMVAADSERAHPLLAIQTCQSCDGKEDSILLGELFILICAMRNRANQRRVDDEDEQMALWDDPSPSNLEKYDFEFPDERHFPVLLAVLRWASAWSLLLCLHGQGSLEDLAVDGEAVSYQSLYSDTP